MTDVVFTIDLPDGAQANIVLAPHGDEIRLDFDDGEEATIELNPKRDYPVEWEFIGADGAELSVSWKAGDRSGRMIDRFKIDKKRHDTRPWAGGKWKSIGFSTFPRIDL